MKKNILIPILFITNLLLAQNFQDTKGELQISNSGTATYNLGNFLYKKTAKTPFL